MEIIRNPNFEFLAKARYFVVLSILFIAAGILWIARGNLRYGAVIQVFGETRDNQVLVRIAGEASESDLDAPARAIMRALGEGYSQNAVTESSSEIVGPMVGAELRRKAIILTVLGLLFQLIYIAARARS